MRRSPRTPTAATAVLAAVALVAALVVDASLPAGATAHDRRAAPAPSPEALLNCRRQPVVAPSSFVITCADANSQLLGLRWASWNEGAATATATFVTNTCTPNCAVGKFVDYPALVELSGALATNLGVVYTTLFWQYQDKGKVQHERFSLLPAQERLVGCLHRSSVAPASFVIACADANSELEQIHWRSWGLGAAAATATYVANTCTPTCAAGRFVSHPATVELSGARFSDVGIVFTTLHWQYEAAGTRHSESFALLG